jgi:hypothetical protein
VLWALTLPQVQATWLPQVLTWLPQATWVLKWAPVQNWTPLPPKPVLNLLPPRWAAPRDNENIRS